VFQERIQLDRDYISSGTAGNPHAAVAHTNGENASIERGAHISDLSFRAQSACGTPHQQALLERYEQMVRDLYRYQLGSIAFLEMLDKWEQLLGVSSEPLPTSER
jgi:hypothetical protein